MRVDKFEQLEVWKNSIKLNKKVYEVTGLKTFNKDYSFIDQLRRASLSVPANIAEGFERSTNKEFKQFLYIAKGSAGEVRTYFTIANQLGYLDESSMQEMIVQIEFISKQLSKLIQYLDSSTL